jgi:hypothetical protein
MTGEQMTRLRVGPAASPLTQAFNAATNDLLLTAYLVEGDDPDVLAFSAAVGRLADAVEAARTALLPDPGPPGTPPATAYIQDVLDVYGVLIPELFEFGVTAVAALEVANTAAGGLIKRHAMACHNALISFCAEMSVGLGASRSGGRDDLSASATRPDPEPRRRSWGLGRKRT